MEPARAPQSRQRCAGRSTLEAQGEGGASRPILARPSWHLPQRGAPGGPENACAPRRWAAEGAGAARRPQRSHAAPLPARSPLSPFAYAAITPHDTGLGGWPRVSSSRARAQVHLSLALTLGARRHRCRGVRSCDLALCVRGCPAPARRAAQRSPRPACIALAGSYSAAACPAEARWRGCRDAGGGCAQAAAA
jgi:hypothetical protein